MTNISSYPLQDNFKTTLSQQWDGATGTVYVASTPSFTFPAGVTTYIVASPGKTTMQIAKINAYDATAKTLTVSSISLKKGASINSTAQTHSVGAEIIISDNYQFWEDIYTAVNSKVDGNVQGFPNYADATARDAAIPSPSNGMMIYNTGAGEFQVYQAGSWTSLASGSTQPNASTTVAGKVEEATTAESIAGTQTGGTGAELFVNPLDIAKNTQSGTFVYGADAGGDDTYVVALTPVLAAYTEGQRLTFTPTTTNTGACSVDFGPSLLNIKTKDGNDPQSGVLRALTPVTGTRYGANFIIDNEDFSTTANKGIAEMATDAEAIARTDQERYVNPKQLGDFATDIRKFPITRFVYDCSVLARLTTTNDSGGTTTLVANGISMNVSGAGQDSTSNTINAVGQVFNGTPAFGFVVIPSTSTNTDNEVYLGLGAVTISAAGGHTFTVNHIGFKIIIVGGAVVIRGTVGDGVTEAATTTLLTVSSTTPVELFCKVNSSSSVTFSARINGGSWTSADVTTNIPTLTTTTSTIQMSYRAGNTVTDSIIVENLYYERF